jgi:hypothetical protein
MPENLGQKGLTKVVKVCIKITLDFVSKGQMDVKRGIMVLKRVKRECQMVLDDVYRL